MYSGKKQNEWSASERQERVVIARFVRLQEKEKQQRKINNGAFGLLSILRWHYGG
jgi:hypothetical protein